MQLVEGPYVDRRVLPRLSSGEAPSLLFRIMSRAEFEAGERLGRFVPRERMHASIEPLFAYAEPGDQNVLVAIDYEDSDGWMAKQTTVHGVVAVTEQAIYHEKVRLLAAGSRYDIEAEYRLILLEEASAAPAV